MNSRRLALTKRIVGLLRRIDGLTYLPPLSELSQEFGVCERTIRRDLEAFEQLGVRVPLWRYNDRAA